MVLALLALHKEKGNTANTFTTSTQLGTGVVGGAKMTHAPVGGMLALLLRKSERPVPP